MSWRVSGKGSKDCALYRFNFFGCVRGVEVVIAVSCVLDFRSHCRDSDYFESSNKA